MPSGSYNQVYVQCHFYKEDDGKFSITCEGFGDARYLKQMYYNKSQYTTQIGVFCCENYQRCEVYRLIMETKYDEEEWSMERQKQCDLILQHMEEHGSINPKEAETEYGCMRLAARINDLRNRGVAIETEIVKSLHSNSRYAVYRLAVDDDAG